MKWKIEIDIEGDKPPSDLISLVKSEVENKVLQLLTDGNNTFDKSYCQYTNIKAYEVK